MEEMWREVRKRRETGNRTEGETEGSGEERGGRM